MKGVLFKTIGVITFFLCIISCGNHNKPIVAKLVVAQDNKTNGILEGWEYNNTLHRTLFFRFILVNPSSDTLFVPLGYGDWGNHKYNSLLSLSIPGNESFKPKLYDVFCNGTKHEKVLCPKDTMILQFVMADFVADETDSMNTIDIMKLFQKFELELMIDPSDAHPKGYRVPQIQLDKDTTNAKVFRSIEEVSQYYERHFSRQQ